MTDGSILTGDHCRIAWSIEGPDEAPVLLLSNSLGTTMAMWEPQIDEFAACFRVLRYDQRGHGASDVPLGAYSMDRLGRDVIELLDGLGIDRVHFCGLSLGGMVGQWLGTHAPERLDKLILANTSSFMGPPQGWDARIDTVLAEGLAGMANASAERWFSPGFRSGAPEVVEHVLEIFRGIDPRGYAGCCAAIRDMDQRRTVHVVDRPTLVIGGRQDPATPPPHSEALVAAIDGSRLVMLDGAHLSNVEQPRAFAGAVIDFLQG